MNLRSIFSVVLISLIWVYSCAEHSNFVGVSRFDKNNPTITTTITQDGRIQDSWIQSRMGLSQKIDLMFVLDGSSSMNDETEVIKAALSGFVTAIMDQGMDLCVAVIAASPLLERSGQLFSLSGNDSDKVICSKSVTRGTFIGRIQENLNTHTVDTVDETGLYSFKESFLNQSNLNKNQNLGFFRDDATLAVIFVADENDISTSPVPNNPLLCAGAPQYNFSPQGIVDENELLGDDCKEAQIRQDYLSNANGELIWGHQRIYREALGFQQVLPFYSAIIGYLEPNVNGEMAHGYLDFVNANGGYKIDIKYASSENQQDFY